MKRHSIWKRMAAFALCVCIVGTMAACGSPAGESSSGENAQVSSGDTAMRTVTDNGGNEVTVPSEINRIAIISTMPLASVYCMVGGDASKIVGLTPSSQNAAVTSLLNRVAPELADVSTAFAQGDTPNVEEIVGLNPDVVFYNLSAAEDVAAVEQLQKMGIPCVGFSTGISSTIDTISKWAELLGDVLGKETQADDIVAYGRKVETMVKERVASVPESERKSALILTNYTESSIVAAGNTFGQYWLHTIGAEDVADEIDQAVSPVNLEQVYEWDPDVIFLNSFSAFTADQIINSTAVDGQDWSGLTAVKNKEVYKFPLGMYYWFPPCSDSPLALEWLAKNLYPDLFEDIDMEQEIKDYYSKFYGITLTDEDIDTIYNPPASSAMVY